MNNELLFNNRFLKSKIDTQRNKSQRKKQLQNIINKHRDSDDLLSTNNLSNVDGTMQDEFNEYSQLYQQVEKYNKEGKNQKFKRTVVNIDSRNRNKIDKLITEQTTTIEVLNPITIQENSFIIIIHHPNHNFQKNTSNEIIIKNLSGDIHNRVHGIPVDFINYNSSTGGPVHIIKEILYENNGKSNYYVVEVSPTINSKNITTGICGTGIIIEKVLSKEKGYTFPSNYKIKLDRTFYNIHSVRLISTEIPNTSVTIKSSLNKDIDTTIYNLSKNNNKISWINKSEYIEESNLTAVTDNIMYSSLNRDKIQNIDNSEDEDTQSPSINTNPNSLQLSLANNLLHEINSDSEKLVSYNIITSPEYSDSYYYSPSIFFSPSAKWNLPDSYHFMGETMVKHIDNMINNINNQNKISEISNDFELYNTGNNIIQKNYGWLYHYYGKYRQNLESVTLNLEFLVTDENLNILKRNYKKGEIIYQEEGDSIIEGYIKNSVFLESDCIDENGNKCYYEVGDSNWEGNINIEIRIHENIHINNGCIFTKKKVFYTDDSDNTIELGIPYSINNITTPFETIPSYLGYFIIDKQSDSFDKEYTIKVGEKILQLVPIVNPNSIGIIMKHCNIINKATIYRKYPINEINLSPGRYNNNSIIKLITEGMNNFNYSSYDWKIKDWVKNDFLSGKFNNNNINDKKSQLSFFDININKALDLIEFRQYSSFDTHDNIETTDMNYKIGKFIINQGYPYIYTKFLGKNLKTGDRIKINNSKKIFNIPKEDLNKEHIIKVCPKYELYIRIIYPLPSKSYYHSEAQFNLTNIDINEVNKSIENYLLDPQKACLDFIDDLNSNIKRNLIIERNGDVDVLNGNKFVEKPFIGIHNMSFLNKNTFETTMVTMGSQLVNKSNNKINRSNAGNLESYGPETPFLENELLVLHSQLNSDQKMIIGRILNFGDSNSPNYKTADSNGNYLLRIQLESEEALGNFKIGDIITGMSSSAIGMIVPESWGMYSNLTPDIKGEIDAFINREPFEYEKCLPTKEIIEKGFVSYLKDRNDFLQQYYSERLDGLIVSNQQIIENYKSIVEGQYLNQEKWPIAKIDNSDEGFIFKINRLPKKSSLEGLSDENLVISKPVKFTILFGKDETPKDILGFKNNSQGDSKTELQFQEIISNTIRDKITTIKNSSLLPIYSEFYNNNILLELNDKIPYQEGDRIYIDSHRINGLQQNTLKSKELDIKNMVPFKDWLTQFQNRMLKHHFMSALSNNSEIEINTNTNNYGTKSILSGEWLQLSSLEKSKRAAEQLIIELSHEKKRRYLTKEGTLELLPLDINNDDIIPNGESTQEEEEKLREKFYISSYRDAEKEVFIEIFAIKKWFYDNIEEWTRGNIYLRNKIFNLFPRKVGKIIVINNRRTLAEGGYEPFPRLESDDSKNYINNIIYPDFRIYFDIKDTVSEIDFLNDLGIEGDGILSDSTSLIIDGNLEPEILKEEFQIDDGILLKSYPNPKFYLGKVLNISLSSHDIETTTKNSFIYTIWYDMDKSEWDSDRITPKQWINKHIIGINPSSNSFNGTAKVVSKPYIGPLTSIQTSEQFNNNEPSISVCKNWKYDSANCINVNAVANVGKKLEYISNNDANIGINNPIEREYNININDDEKAAIEYLYEFYLKNKVICQYSSKFNKAQENLLQNTHTCIHDSNSNNEKDINYNYLPKHVFNSGDKLYIHAHQKKHQKYWSHAKDLNKNNESANLIEKIMKKEDVSISENEKNYEITGIKSSSYNVLTNLWPGFKEILVPFMEEPNIIWESRIKKLQYVSNNFLDFQPGNTVLLDLNWNEAIEKGYLNKGKIRASGYSINICGNNPKRDIYQDLEEEIYSYLKENINYDSRNIIVNDVSNFKIGYSIIISAFIKGTHNNLENSKKEAGTYLYNSNNTTNNHEYSEINIIQDIDYENNTIILESPLINNHLKNALIIQRYFMVELSGDIIAGSNRISVKNNSKNIGIGSVIVIDLNEINYNLEPNQEGYYLEETNTVIGIIQLSQGQDEEVLYNNESNYILLEKKLKYSHSDKARIAIITETKHTKNQKIQIPISYQDNGNTKWKLPDNETENLKDINYTSNIGDTRISKNCLSTQNIQINGEWYTKVFYFNGRSCEPFSTKDYKGGFESFSRLGNNKVYISGMKGINRPVNPLKNNRYFDNIEEHRKNNKYYKQYYVEQIEPIPDGYYTIHHSFDEIILDSSLKIMGEFEISEEVYNYNNVWADSEYKEAEPVRDIVYDFENEIINSSDFDLDTYQLWYCDYCCYDGLVNIHNNNKDGGCVYTGLNENLQNECFYSDSNNTIPREKDACINPCTWLEKEEAENNCIKCFTNDFLEDDNIYEQFNNASYDDIIDSDNNFQGDNCCIPKMIRTFVPYPPWFILAPSLPNECYDTGINGNDISNTNVPFSKGNIVTYSNSGRLPDIKDRLEYCKRIYIPKEEYYYILIKGKYNGYGGKIDESWEPEDNTLNNPNGYTITKILSDNKNHMIINLKQELLNIKYQKSMIRFQNNSYIKNIFDSGYNYTIPPSLMFDHMLDLQNDNHLIQNILGYGGTVYQKKLDNPINLKGQSYILMRCPTLKNIKSSEKSEVKDVFAKIILSSEPGEILFDTFVDNPAIFYNSPLHELNELEFVFVNNNNELFDFNQQEHSFTLEIIELENRLDYVNSRTGNVEF